MWKLTHYQTVNVQLCRSCWNYDWLNHELVPVSLTWVVIKRLQSHCTHNHYYFHPFNTGWSQKCQFQIYSICTHCMTVPKSQIRHSGATCSSLHPKDAFSVSIWKLAVTDCGCLARSWQARPYCEKQNVCSVLVVAGCTYYSMQTVGPYWQHPIFSNGMHSCKIRHK